MAIEREKLFEIKIYKQTIYKQTNMINTFYRAESNGVSAPSRTIKGCVNKLLTNAYFLYNLKDGRIDNYKQTKRKKRIVRKGIIGKLFK